MNRGLAAKATRLATYLLLVVVPLLWTPLTEDLRPQKALVFALSLPLCALGAPSVVGLVSLLLGLGWLVASPDAPWTSLAFFAAPTIHASLAATQKTNPKTVQTILRRVIVVISIVALLGALGLAPLDTSRFHLPYAVLVGTLGNPNHLAALLLIVLPFLTKDLRADDKAIRLESRVAFALGLLVVVLSRSHLAMLVLALQVLIFVPRLAVFSLLPLVFSYAGFARALEGRLYMLRVEGLGLSPRALLLGFGPSELAPRFLDWQASYLAHHPEDLRFWTFPEHPHNDLVAFVLSFGLVTTALALGLSSKRFVLAPTLDRRPLYAAWMAASLFALGVGLASSPALLVVLLLLCAATLQPREGPAAKAWILVAHTMVATIWMLVMLADAYVAYETRAALSAAEVERAPAEALRRLRSIDRLPMDRARRLFLEGRVLVEAGDPHQAALLLREAARRLPHPTVWKVLWAAETAAGHHEQARAAALAWARIRPDDADARALFKRDSRAE